MLKKTKVTFGLLMMVFVLVISGCSSDTTSGDGGASGKVYKWRMVTHQIPGTARYDSVILPFVEAVEEASNGRLIIEPYGADDLFPTDESFDAVKDGVVEMGAIFSGFWTGKDPVFGLAGGIPGDPIQDFSEHFYRSEKLEPILDKAYEEHGIVNLGSFDYAPNEILMADVPIRSLEDFKGKNIRAAGIANVFYSELGASSISLSAPEIYTGLQLGTVDAAEYNDFLVNKEMGLHEVTKYVIEPAMHVGPLSDKELIVNPKAWDELPDDLQAIVIAARDRARYESAVAYSVDNSMAEEEWIESGVEVIDLPDEDVEKVREIGFDMLLDLREESPLSKEYVDMYAESLFDLGYEEEAALLGFKEGDKKDAEDEEDNEEKE